LGRATLDGNLVRAIIYWLLNNPPVQQAGDLGMFPSQRGRPLGFGGRLGDGGPALDSRPRISSTSK
jgi:hypothetical protein